MAPEARPEWIHLVDLAVHHQEQARRCPVSPKVEARGLRRHLERHFDFREPRELAELTARAAEFLSRSQVNANHPRHFGLFHPGVSAAGAVGEYLVGLFNPQLATWSHAPGARELEAHVLRFLAGRLGLPTDGHATFTSGGQESLQGAVTVALAQAFPELPARGLRSLPGQPVLYLSEEGHESLVKVAAASGLGHGAVRRVPTDAKDRLSLPALRDLLQADRASGHLPFLVVGTAGTTATGAVDPLMDLAALCREEGVWFHVDAAWAGSACFSRRLKGLLDGIERADSVNWNAHKWLWVPLGAGMFFCRHPEPVRRAFGVRAERYVPRSGKDVEDPYATTSQWSRRCRGLPVLLTLAELGEEGVTARVDHQVAMGDHLRDQLRGAGWEVKNDTPLPLVCFTHPDLGEDREAVARLARRVNAMGRAWLSVVARPPRRRWLRACITHPRTGPEDVDALLAALEAAREAKAP